MQEFGHENGHKQSFFLNVTFWLCHFLKMNEEVFPLPQFVLEYLQNKNVQIIPNPTRSNPKNRYNIDVPNAIGSLELYGASRTPYKIESAYKFFVHNIVLNSPLAFQKEFKQLIFPMFLNLAYQLNAPYNYEDRRIFIEKYRHDQPAECQPKIQQFIDNPEIRPEITNISMCREAYHELLAIIDNAADDPNTAILSYILNSAVKVTEVETVKHDYIFTNDNSVSMKPNSLPLIKPCQITLPPYSARYQRETSMMRPQLVSEDDIPFVQQNFPDICNIEIFNHNNRLTEVQISPNGRLFSYVQGMSVYMNSIDQISNLGERNTLRLVTHCEQVLATAFSSDSRLFASGSLDGIIKISHLEALIPYMIINTGIYPIYSVTFDATATFIACGCGDKTIKVFYMRTGALLRVCIGHNQPPTKIIFSSDSKRLISISDDQTVKFWDLDSHDPYIGSFSVPSPPTSVSLDPTNTKLAVGMKNGLVALWDTQTGVRMWQSGNDLDTMITETKFTLDGSLLLAASVNGLLGGWKYEDNEMVMKVDAVSSTLDAMIITSRNSVITAGRSLRGDITI